MTRFIHGFFGRVGAVWSILFPNPRYYGWAIVWVCFLCSALSSPGQSFVISLYIDHAMADLGLSRLEISSLYATMTLAAAACLPFVGTLADRIGGRRFLSIVILLVGLAGAFFASVQSAVMLGAAFFFLRLLGQGSVGLGTLTEAVRWFRRYRSRALAIVSLGYAAGEMVFPALVLGLIGAFGWRGSLWNLALVYALVFTPLVAILLRERRPDEPVDGAVPGARHQDQADTSAPASPATSDEGPEEPEFALREVLRRPGFWIMVLCLSIFPMAVTGLIFHQVAIFDTIGWGARRIPVTFALFAAASMAMTYGTGFVLERVSSRFAVSASLVMMATAMAIPALSLSPLTAASLYGLFLGMSSGVSAQANSMVWPEYYGIAALGAVKGVVTAVRNGATALGPPLIALLAGDALRFGTSFVAIATLCGLGAAAALFVRPPRPDLSRPSGR